MPRSEVPIPFRYVDEAELTARPVVWDDPEWLGFSGTCFAIELFGGVFGITARHVLGSKVLRWKEFRVPKNLDDVYPTLLIPKSVYWYNAGAYDHVADIAVVV